MGKEGVLEGGVLRTRRIAVKHCLGLEGRCPGRRVGE